MTEDQELFFKVAKHLGIEVSDDEGISQVEVNKAYMKLIGERIIIKVAIVDCLKLDREDKEGLDALLLEDKIQEYNKQILDLEIEYAAKRKYITHHENFFK